MKKLFLISALTLSVGAHAKLLDKIAGVVNENVFTLSEINRVTNTLNFRKEVAPFIYQKNKYSNSDILKLLQNNYIIKDKLSELGFVVSDDSVESRINETEKGLGLNRAELHQFLKSKGVTFSEYFEIIREAMEFNIFNSRIIAPLVTITDQEIKNHYITKVASNNSKALSFKYTLVNFTLSKDKVLDSDIVRLPEILKKYRATGNIPAIYSSISTNDLGTLSADDLPKEFSKALSNVTEKNFAKPIVKDGTVHIFYVVKKELADSPEFIRAKPRVYQDLFLERSKSIIGAWFAKESLNYYIVNNL